MKLNFLVGAFAISMAILATGCAQQPRAAGDTSSLADILVEVGPCHGKCPVYSVDISEDGTTRFTGRQFTAIDGERVRTSDPERFALVRQQLSSWQPVMGTEIETPDCGPRATDLSHYTVTWTNLKGEKAILKHDSGCHSDDARRLTQRLRALPQTLGIEEWVRR